MNNTQETAYYSGVIELDVKALEPIIHSESSSGNESYLRTQDFVLESGEIVQVPFISGNAIKHFIRENGAKFAIETMGIKDGELSIPLVDLLASGGQLSKKGTAIDVNRARKLETLFPLLGVCAYSAGNTMQRAKISVSHLQLVCEENRERMPDKYLETPQSKLSSWDYRGDDFGTRPDSKHDRLFQRKLLPIDSQKLLDKAVEQLNTKGKPKKDKDDIRMIYKFQCIKAGALLWGDVHYKDLTEMEMAALSSAFSYACAGETNGRFSFYIGAKNSVGFGKVGIKFTTLNKIIDIKPPTYSEQAGLIQIKTLSQKYIDHLHTNRDEILTTLRAITL